MVRYTAVFLAVVLVPLVTANGRGSSCTSDDDCDGRLSCLGIAGNMRCLMKKPSGMRCGVDPFWVCQDDLACEAEICKIGRRGECTAPGSICVDGLTCVGTDDIKRCVQTKVEGMPCGRDPFWVCADGLVCVDEVCRKAVGRGKRCGSRRICKSRFVCAGPRRGTTCVIPGMPGRRCGAFDTCRDSTCVDGRCMT